MKMLENLNVVVIGGLGFLGKSISEALLDEGARIIIADKTMHSENENWEDKTLSNYVRVKISEVDITSRNSLESLLNKAEKEFGPIDAVVNTAYPRNAHYGRRLEEVTYTDFCENVSLHLGGYFLVCQVFSSYFAEKKKGNIINISSIYGVVPPRFEIYDNTPLTMPVEYAAIKSGLIHLTKYFAKYYKNAGIKFNCVSPGGLKDKQPESFLNEYKKFALNKGMLDPKDIVGSVVFLLSDLSEYINGQNIIVDDGWAL